jgi:hypothetical protein
VPTPEEPATTAGLQQTPTTASSLPEPATTSPSASTTAEVVSATTKAVAVTTTAGSIAIGEVPQWIVDLVVADAASTQGVAAAAVYVVSTEAGDWPNGSLGCPELGVMYTQALVPGYLVVLNVNNAVLAYHLDQEGNFKVCRGGTFTS